MKVVIQKVKNAKVIVNNNIVGSINKGVVALIGITSSDASKQIEWMANKIANLRIFDDDTGVMNKSLLDIENTGILFISNFTLYGNTKKGFRPSYIDAARSEIAGPIYEQFIQHFRNLYSDKIKIQEGIFGAMMDVELINDGPVTLIIEN